MRMIRISVEIRYASGPFRVMVEAESIRRAVERIQRRYPGCEVKPVFPIDPETFFVDEVAKVRQVGPKASGRSAA
jgi:hypothetical protein